MTFTPWFLDDNDWQLPTEIEEDDMATPCAVIGIVVVAGLMILLWKLTEVLRR